MTYAGFGIPLGYGVPVVPVAAVPIGLTPSFYAPLPYAPYGWLGTVPAFWGV